MDEPDRLRPRARDPAAAAARLEVRPWTRAGGGPDDEAPACDRVGGNCDPSHNPDAGPTGRRVHRSLESAPWALGLFVSAIVLALEANALRVAGISIGLEQMGAMSREWKDWIQIGTTGLALGQLAGIERLIGHPEAHGRVAGHVRAQSLDE